MSEMENKKMAAEIVLVVIGASFMGAIGILAFWSGITGIEPCELKLWQVLGILLGLSGGISGGMLLSVCLQKNAKSSNEEP